MNSAGSDYGLWGLVVVNSVVFIGFAYSFFKPRTTRDWRSFGAFSAFLVALFAVLLLAAASGLTAAYLQWHLERQLRTLPLVERVYRADHAVADHRISLLRQDVHRGDEPGDQLAAGS